MSFSLVTMPHLLKLNVWCYLGELLFDFSLKMTKCSLYHFIHFDNITQYGRMWLLFIHKEVTKTHREWSCIHFKPLNDQIRVTKKSTQNMKMETKILHIIYMFINAYYCFCNISHEVRNIKTHYILHGPRSICNPTQYFVRLT